MQQNPASIARGCSVLSRGRDRPASSCLSSQEQARGPDHHVANLPAPAEERGLVRWLRCSLLLRRLQTRFRESLLLPTAPSPEQTWTFPSDLPC